MSYDPADNPRYLGPTDEELVEEEQEALDREADDLHRRGQLAATDEALRVFETAGWAHIEATLNKDLAIAQGLVLAGTLKTQREEDRLRGEVKRLNWFLELPETFRKYRDSLVDEIRSNTEQPGDGDLQGEE